MTASRYDLLPPNATTLERDLSRVTSSLTRAGGPVPTIRTAKRLDIPDSVVPWLIYEYGLGEILPYLGNNQRTALAEGVLWQRIRGTPAAILIALGWIGITGAVVDESEGGSYRWAEYQLGLAEPTEDDATIDQIVGVAKISSPVRSRLQRIYSGYDFRRAVYDNCAWSDGSIYSDHSGVRLRPDWPQISFGRSVGLSVQASASAVISHNETIGILVDSNDRFRYDFNKWGDAWTMLNAPAQLGTDEGLSAAYQNQVWGAFVWQQESWQTINVVASTAVTTTIPAANTALLLHLDGNATDSSIYAKPSLSNAGLGGPTYTSQQTYFPGVSARFVGNQVLRYSLGTQVNGIFAVDVWAFATAEATHSICAFIEPDLTGIENWFGTMPMWNLRVGSNGSLQLQTQGISPAVFLTSAAGTVPLGQWVHLSWARGADGLTRLRVNGAIVAQAAAGSPTVALGGATPQLLVGCFQGDRYLQEFRLVLGVDEYGTNTFTPPAQRYPSPTP